MNESGSRALPSASIAAHSSGQTAISVSTFRRELRRSGASDAHLFLLELSSSLSARTLPPRLLRVTGHSKSVQIGTLAAMSIEFNCSLYIITGSEESEPRGPLFTHSYDPLSLLIVGRGGRVSIIV